MTRTTTAEIRHWTVVSGGVHLAVHEQGDPALPTVLLVHGYPDTHTVWDEVATGLAADHHVARYDVRGAGASGAPDSRRDYRLDRLADDLFAVAAAVSPDRPVHVVAHDWGSVQSWEAVTDPRAQGRIASFTTISGPCLDHVGHWFRRRISRPTPRHLGQLATQTAHSWYIAAFHLPFAPAVWRRAVAPNWTRVLRHVEGLRRVPAGHPQPTLADDAVHGLRLYRENMLSRLRHPGERPTAVPVQLIDLTRDRYVGAALHEDLGRWVPRLWRRTMPVSHWSALLEHAPTVARMVREFTAHIEGAPAPPALDRARTPRGARRGPSARSYAGSSASSSAGFSGRSSARSPATPFAGRLAVVTGAGSGIGRATALAFAHRGADIAVCDIDLEAAERTAARARDFGRDAHAYQVDVSDGAAVDAFAADVAAEHGVPDIVVNNAGVGHSGTFLATTEREWERVLDVNLWGVIHGCRAFGTLMAERGEGGHIVNVESAAAYLPSKVLAAYATSKAAVHMLSDCLRAELAPAGIGVSSICPGFVNTPITRTATFSGLTAKELDAKRAEVSALYARRGFPPHKVAAEILRAVRGRKAVVPVTVEAKAAWLLGRISPGLLRAAARFTP